MRNVELAKAIAADGRKKYVISGEARISPPILHDIVNGNRPGTPEQRERLADVLGCTVDELFAETSVV